MKHTLTRLVALMTIPIALLASGCFNLESHVVVNEDGSGSQTIRFALPAEIASSMGMGQELPTVEELESEADFQAFQQAIGDFGEMRVFSNEEDGIGFEVTIRVDASDDFAAAVQARMEEVASAVPTEMFEDGMSPFDMADTGPFELYREGDEWVFEQAMEMPGSEMLGDLTGDDSGMMADLILDQISITTTLKLPGDITEHNADEVRDDGTLVWTQTGVGDMRTLSARSNVGGGGLSTMGMTGLAIGGLALLGFGGFLLASRRRSD